MLDRDPRTFWVLVHSGFGDWQDAGALAAACDAVLIFATPHCSDSLVVNDRIEKVLSDPRVRFDMLASQAQVFIGLQWVPLVVQERRTRVAGRGDFVWRKGRVTEDLIERFNARSYRYLEVLPDLLERRIARPWLDGVHDPSVPRSIEHLARHVSDILA